MARNATVARAAPDNRNVPALGVSGSEEWIIDNTSSIRGLRPTLIGSPRVTDTPHGPALCFDGDDGILLAKNPLENLEQFTLQVLFRCDSVSKAETHLAEPRFLHIETEAGARATIEARVTETSFALDTYLRSGTERRTLLEISKRHSVGVWHWGALSYAEGQMRHFIDGVEVASGTLTLTPLGAGKMSLGVRQNLVYWFKGCVKKLRVTSRALPPEALESP